VAKEGKKCRPKKLRNLQKRFLIDADFLFLTFFYNMALDATNIGETLTIDRVNEVLGQMDWVAVNFAGSLYEGSLGARGFELAQGHLDVDGDFVTTSDTLPVVEAIEIGNTVRFRLLDGAQIDLHELAA